MLRFGKGEGSELLQPGHAWNPLLFLILAAEVDDSVYCEAGSRPEERVDAPVALRQFHGREPRSDRAETRAPVSLYGVTTDTERGKLRDQLKRELAALPAVGHDGDDLSVRERPYTLADLALLLG